MPPKSVSAAKAQRTTCTGTRACTAKPDATPAIQGVGMSTESGVARLSAGREAFGVGGFQSRPAPVGEGGAQNRFSGSEGTATPLSSHPRGAPRSMILIFQGGIRAVPHFVEAYFTEE